MTEDVLNQGWSDGGIMWCLKEYIRNESKLYALAIPGLFFEGHWVIFPPCSISRSERIDMRPNSCKEEFNIGTHSIMFPGFCPVFCFCWLVKKHTMQWKPPNSNTPDSKPEYNSALLQTDRSATNSWPCGSWRRLTSRTSERGILLKQVTTESFKQPSTHPLTDLFGPYSSYMFLSFATIAAKSLMGWTFFQ